MIELQGTLKPGRVDLHVTILTQQVSNYHVARYKAASRAFREVSVLSVRNDADFPEFLATRDWEGRLHRLCSGQGDYSKAVSDGSLWGRVVEALDGLRPDMVAVAGWAFPESLAAIAWARTNDRPVVIMSASQAEDEPRRLHREYIKQRIVRCCDGALVGAERHKAYIVRLGLVPESVFLGYDAVDNDYFARAADEARTNGAARRSELSLPDRYLVATGRLIGKKNFPRLVAAFSSALKFGDYGHHLVIAGDGPERSAIEAAAATNGLSSRVHILGFRDYTTLPALYGLSEGFLHVSLVEQWGLVINEAAASALPLVVSYPCGACSALVQAGVNGYIVDPADVSDMARGVAGVMALSPESRAAMGSKSREIVTNWGPERFASGLAQAASSARLAPNKKHRLIDKLLFRLLARVQFSHVH